MDETIVTTDIENDIVDNEQEQQAKEPAYFTAMEARVIGALMEKHLTTPNNYPLTLNSLCNACNQKSNREPVMKLTEGQVGHTINILVERKLAGIDYGDRSNKISHRVCNELAIDRKQQAILTVLLLRKPQTLNDIKTRTARMVDFESNEEIHDTITDMIEREMPLVTLIPKGAGRREDRFAHTLCGEVSVEEIEKDPVMVTSTPVDNDRLDALEARIAAIEAKLGIS
ncbi:YceH family protein [uncultured Cocleimonas sp.]|uniref:YceH family protein n=1 Tax=uncultured Cocleimonas sp. TaxID=1051587 RepID=UPI002629FBC0|nr:YceH family protein [uncultured Cocleimonas sp.]